MIRPICSRPSPASRDSSIIVSANTMTSRRIDARMAGGGSAVPRLFSEMFETTTSR